MEGVKWWGRSMISVKKSVSLSQLAGDRRVISIEPGEVQHGFSRQPHPSTYAYEDGICVTSIGC
eukprot:1325539-Amorphochlora_amoeboformis.AAC.1